MTETTRKEMDQVLSELTLLHYRLMEMGLLRTAHAMHETVRVAGYEAAEIIGGKHPTKLAVASAPVDGARKCAFCGNELPLYCSRCQQTG